MWGPDQKSPLGAFKGRLDQTEPDPPTFRPLVLLYAHLGPILTQSFHMDQNRLTDQIRPRPVAVPSTLLIVAIMLATAVSASEAVAFDASQRVHERSTVRVWSSSIVRAVRCLVSGQIQSGHAQCPPPAATLAAHDRRPVLSDRAASKAVITRLLRSRLIDLPPPAILA